MADDAPSKTDTAPRKKKKKKKPLGASGGSKPSPVVAKPAPPPPPASTPIGTIAVVCVVGGLLGAFVYQGVVKSSAPAGADSASAAAPASGGDPTATPSDVAAPPADAKKTDSGLAYKVLRKGDDKGHPKPSDTVKVHYAGWSKDGKLFDSSYTRGQPASFGVTQVIKGWTEGLQLMSVGEKTRFWIPAALAYGEQAGGGRPSGQLTFDVELLEISQ